MEILCESALGMMEGVMGREAARYFFPLIGTLAFFILFSNLAGLILRLTPPTDVISTNAVMALIVFLCNPYLWPKEKRYGAHQAYVWSNPCFFSTTHFSDRNHWARR